MMTNTMDWYTIDGGGTYTLSKMIGQADAPTF